MFRYVLTLLASCVLLVAPSGAAAADQTQQACPQGQLLDEVIDTASGLPSPCIVGAASFVSETLYFQNASKVGGTALAGYPLVRLLAGVSGRTDVVVDAPSQIAESGLHGEGLYPISSPGFGLNYSLADAPRVSLGIGAEDHPPASLFSTSPRQAGYSLDMTSLYRITRSLAFDGSLTGSMLKSLGAQRLLPTMDLGVNYAVSPATMFVTDVGERVTRRDHAQSFSDVSITRSLGKNVALDTGLGTTFNQSSGAKAHYLSAGLDLR